MLSTFSLHLPGLIFCQCTSFEHKIQTFQATKKLKAPPPPTTPKGRIAEALGIRPSKPWEMVPTMQPAIKEHALGSLRAGAALPHLSLLGLNADVDVTSE